MTVYIASYIDLEFYENSYICRVSHDKSEAISAILNAASYTEKDGMLHQFGSFCDEYESYQELYDKISNECLLYDAEYDLYTLTCLEVQNLKCNEKEKKN